MNRKQRRAAVGGRRTMAPRPTDRPVGAGEDGKALFRAGRLSEAEALAKRLLAAQGKTQDADTVGALHLLGLIAQRRNDHQVALAYFDRALAIVPDAAEIHFDRGLTLKARGALEEAIAALRQAIAIEPRLANAHRRLGFLLLSRGRLEQAEEVLTQAVRLDPQDAMAHHFLGNVYSTQNRRETAVASYRKAVSLDPELTMARLGVCDAQLPVIYDSEDQIAERRAAYERSLHELRDYYDGKPREVLARAAGAVGSVQPFFLAYQGLNDRGLQALYGELMCRLMAAAYPQWSAPLSMPEPGPDGRIRVGILSGFFCAHSNWKIPIKGWAEQLDRSKLRLFGYYTQNKSDAQTQKAEGVFERFVIGGGSLKRLVEAVRGDDLHVLIIPEVGMDPITAQLAALRLAPVQCGSWGHPQTSGYPTMDYFVSSDLMEPDNGQDNYTEQLVRLPNLSIHYSPSTVEPAEVSRAELGLRPDSVAYWCCQAPFKYLPRYDDLFPRIAAEVGDCQFVFIRHRSDFITRSFQARLQRAFTRYRLDDRRHCVFVDRMATHRFAGAMKSVDIFLDSLGWSGCNTTMEAIAAGLPVITCPGDLMRGRHSSAILQMLGLEQAIAPTIEDYVKLAVALGRDGERRQEFRRLTVERHGRAYGDLESIRGLDDFLCRVAGSA